MLTRILRILGGIALSLSAALFLFGSMQSVIRLLGAVGPAVHNRLPLFVAALLATGAILLLLSKVLKPLPAGDAVSAFRKPHFYTSVAMIFTILACTAVLLRAIASIQSPMEDDEIVMAVQMGDQTLSSIVMPQFGKSLLGKNQTVSVLASYLWTRITGVNAMTFRLPSIGFTLLLLVILYAFRSRLSPFALVVVLLHLASNELAVWYLHNAKGYVSMLPFSVLLVLVMLSREMNVEWTKAQKRCFLLGLFMLPFCNAFGALFVVFFGLSVALWIFFNYKTQSAEQLKQNQWILRALALSMPLVLLVLWNQATHMRQESDLFSGKSPDYAQAFSHLFGFSFAWQVKLLLVATVWIAFLSFKKSKGIDFLTILVLVTTISLFALIVFLNPAWAFERYYFVFLIPAVLWIAESSLRISPGSTRYVAQAVVVTMLVALPFFNRASIKDRYESRHGPIVEFLKEVRGRTAPVSDHCYVAKGDSFYVSMIEKVYLPDAMKFGVVGECAKSFVLLLRQGHWHPGVDALDSELLSKVEERYRDRNSRFVLYEWKGSEPTLISSR